MEEKKDILAREIQSWEGFEYALREENRLLFHEMLDKCRKNEYFGCVNTKGGNYAHYSLF
jgi:hypothetical protein